MKRAILQDIELGNRGDISKDKINNNFDKLNNIVSDIDNETVKKIDITTKLGFSTVKVPTEYAVSVEVSKKADYSLVANLSNEIDKKANKDDVAISMINKGRKEDVDSLPIDATIGDAYYVESEEFIYQYDGTYWNKTIFSAFPSDVAVKSQVYSNYSSPFILTNTGSNNVNGKLVFDANIGSFARIGLCTTPNNQETETFENSYTNAMLTIISNQRFVSPLGSSAFFYNNGTVINDVTEKKRSDGRYEYTAKAVGNIFSILIQTDNQSNSSLELEVSPDSYIGNLSNIAEAMTYTNELRSSLKDEMQIVSKNTMGYYMSDIVESDATIVDERTIKFKNTGGYLRLGISALKIGKSKLVLESDCDFRVINPTEFYYETPKGSVMVAPKYILGGGNNGRFRIELPEAENILKYFMQLNPSNRLQEITISVSSDSYILDSGEENKRGITYTEIVVKADGTIGIDCNFKDIKSALDSISNNDFYNRYLVFVRNGTYDISDEDYPYLGLKNYVEVIGDSKNGVTIINRKATFSSFNACFDPEYYSDAIEYATIRNMKLICYNGKGPVHIDADYTYFVDKGVIEVENCTLINENTEDMTHYQTGLACGLRSGQTVRGINIDSNSKLWVHNSSQRDAYTGCTFELYNCRFPNTSVSDLYCYGRDKFIMKNCKTDLLSFNIAKHWNEPRDYTRFSFDVELLGNDIGRIVGELETATGDKNQAFWDVAFGGKFGIADSQIHMYCKNNSTEVLPRGRIVSLDQPTNEISVKSWSLGNALYGVCLDDIQIGDYGVIQYRGIVQLLAQKTIGIGEYVELSDTGVVIPHNSGRIIGYSLTELTEDGMIDIRLI